MGEAQFDDEDEVYDLADAYENNPQQLQQDNDKK